jgi:hypothetical protein
MVDTGLSHLTQSILHSAPASSAPSPRPLPRLPLRPVQTIPSHQSPQTCPIHLFLPPIVPTAAASPNAASPPHTTAPRGGSAGASRPAAPNQQPAPLFLRNAGANGWARGRSRLRCMYVYMGEVRAEGTEGHRTHARTQAIELTDTTDTAGATHSPLFAWLC